MPQNETVLHQAGVRRGVLQVGEWVRLTDAKGRKHHVELVVDGNFHTNKGVIAHNDMIGREEGFTVTSAQGTPFLVSRPLLHEYVVSMPRGAAVIYPKDAAQILMRGDIFPGAIVVEAGVGSGALTCSLLRMIGPSGKLHSFELRPEFAKIAARNVAQLFGTEPARAHPAWELTVGDLIEELPRQCNPGSVDRIVLDMLAPWECIEVIAAALAPGGVVTIYVATTTQLSRTVETLRAHGGFTEPDAWELIERGWHVQGLAVRPSHRMNGHTGFLVTARRMAPGQQAPSPSRRPAPGAYGPDYHGPRPPGV